MSEINFIETDASAIYDSIITSLESAVREPLYPGDERRIFGEALAAIFIAVYNKVNDAARQKMLRYARGEVLDAIGERTNTTRLTSKPAHTVMRFSTELAATQNITIPAGTKVTPDGAIYFETDEIAVLPAGEEYVDIPASSQESGSKYNGMLPGSINILVDLIPLITDVTNIDTSHGGNDGEPYTEEGDNSYRNRLRLSPSKYSTAGSELAYKFYALSADPGIIDVKVTTQSPGTITLIPLMAGGEIPEAEILDKVVAACNANDVRAFTDLVTAEAPGQELFDIDIKYYTTAAAEAAAVETIEGSGGAIERYITWQTGAIGRSINPDQLRKLILSPDWADNLTGAVRLDVMAPAFEEVDETTVPHFSGSFTITHEVVFQ